MLVGEVGREGQVLDRGPTGDDTSLRDVVVRVAGERCVACRRLRRQETGAVDGRCGTSARNRTVAHLCIGTIDTGAPVWVPVVSEATATTPSLDQLKLTTEVEHCIGSDPQSNATKGSRHAVVVVALPCTIASRQVLNVVAGCAAGVDTLDVEDVTGSSLRSIERQRSLNGPTPSAVGMATQLAVEGGGDPRTTGAAERTAVRVVARCVVMRGGRQLSITPSLGYHDVADDIRDERTGLVVDASRVRGSEDAEVIDASLIVLGRILHADGAGHAVAELGSIDELVDARDRAATTDETVEVVARIVDER